MLLATLEPRTVDEGAEAAFDLLDDELFAEVDAAHGIVACRSTCVSGFTVKCDGSTFTRTCVSGMTLRCDG